ncbi:MAG: amidase [Gemmatimonadota bacterium]
MALDPEVGREAESSEQGGLSRRTFVGLGALAALGSACAPRQEATPAEAPPQDAPTPSSVRPFELEELTVDALQEGMASGRWSARDLTRMYLERIEAVDRQGPALRSVIETNPDALVIAERLDEERRQGQVRGPLHGIPVLIKDNIATADRMNTTAGSHALIGAVPAEDSFVAARLRAAGAVLLGKANLSEWANFRSTNSSSGWSGRGGQCRNPYVLDRNPCGSSSGSGAAVSANLCALAVGTETNGSIVCPSNANGVVGIKPTLGLVSRTRIIPIAHSQDTAGPMCRTVRDAAILLGALTGVDPEDAATAASEDQAQTDYTQFLSEDGLRGARIGVARAYFGFHPEVDARMEEALEALRTGGATLIEPADIPTRSEMGGPSYQVLLYEFKADLNAYLEALGPSAPVRSLEGLIEFNRANRELEMPWFQQEIFEEAQAKGSLESPEYQEALATMQRLARSEGIDRVMDEHRLDAIVAPTGGPAWVTDLVNGDHFGGGSSSPAAIAGYPNITVPAGLVHGLPVGLSFFGRAWSEPVLLRLAHAFEQATGHRAAPTFRPTLGL